MRGSTGGKGSGLQGCGSRHRSCLSNTRLHPRAGVVSKRVGSDNPRVTAKQGDKRVTSREDRRAYIRVDYSAPVLLRWRCGPAEVTGKTVNVSVRGALVTCCDINDLRPGSHLDIRLAWEREPRRGPRWLCGSGRIVWMRPPLEAGRKAEPEETALLGLNFDGPLHFES